MNHHKQYFLPVAVLFPILATIVHASIVLNKTHVFSDFVGVTSMENVSITMHEVQKSVFSEPVVLPEYPWEGAIYMYTSFLVLTEAERRKAYGNSSLSGGEARIYYNCFSEGSDPHVCVVISTDGGKTFEKPLLPYFPWNSSVVLTNRVWQTNEGGFSGMVSKSNDSDGYGYVLAFELGDDERRMGVAVSKDGLEFHNETIVETLIAGFADTQVALVETADGWVAYGRHDAASQPCPHSEWGNFRRVASAWSNGTHDGPYNTSHDALYITPPYDPEICYDPYNAAPLAYADTYFMFPSMSYHRPDYTNVAPGGERARGNDAVLDVRMASSRDPAGAFSYVSRTPFIPRGVGIVDPKSLLFNGSNSDRDAGFIFMTAGGVLDHDELLSPSSVDFLHPSPYFSVFYFATQATHAWNGALELVYPQAFVGILRATMRRDGFTSISTLDTSNPLAPPNGSFHSEPTILPRTDQACNHNPNASLVLLVNAQTTTAGWLTVGIYNATSITPIPGFGLQDAVPFKGNQVRVPLQWNATGTPYFDLAPVADLQQQVFFAFHLSHAQLFSWTLTCI